MSCAHRPARRSPTCSTRSTFSEFGKGWVGCVVEASLVSTGGEVLFWVTDIQSPQTTQLPACLRACALCASPHIVSSPDTFAARHPSVNVKDIVHTTPSLIPLEDEALLEPEPEPEPLSL